MRVAKLDTDDSRMKESGLKSARNTRSVQKTHFNHNLDPTNTHTHACTHMHTESNLDTEAFMSNALHRERQAQMESRRYLIKKRK